MSNWTVDIFAGMTHRSRSVNWSKFDVFNLWVQGRCFGFGSFEILCAVCDGASLQCWCVFIFLFHGCCPSMSMRFNDPNLQHTFEYLVLNWCLRAFCICLTFDAIACVYIELLSLFRSCTDIAPTFCGIYWFWTEFAGLSLPSDRSRYAHQGFWTFPSWLVTLKTIGPLCFKWLVVQFLRGFFLREFVCFLFPFFFWAHRQSVVMSFWPSCRRSCWIYDSELLWYPLGYVLILNWPIKILTNQALNPWGWWGCVRWCRCNVVPNWLKNLLNMKRTFLRRRKHRVEVQTGEDTVMWSWLSANWRRTGASSLRATASIFSQRSHVFSRSSQQANTGGFVLKWKRCAQMPVCDDCAACYCLREPTIIWSPIHYFIFCPNVCLGFVNCEQAASNCIVRRLHWKNTQMQIGKLDNKFFVDLDIRSI